VGVAREYAAAFTSQAGHNMGVVGIHPSNAKFTTRRWLGASGWLAFLLVCAVPRTAEAWIFPEHAEITRLALDHDLPPELREAVEELLELAHSPESGLCSRLTVPFARLWQTEAPERTKKCVPFNVLPALAGDHAIDIQELLGTLGPPVLQRPDPTRRSSLPQVHRFGPNQQTASPPLSWISFDLSKRFDDFLDDAPIEVSRVYRNSSASGERSARDSDGLRHRFFRSLDVRLEALDADYSNRARGSRAHFQDTSAPIQRLLERAVNAGDLDNALAQTFAHHMRSLKLAYAAGVIADDDTLAQQRAREALLEHAFALHFIQDSFAAGHIGTEHAVNRLDRLRRHDFLNRVGLPATRVMSVRGCSSATAADDRNGKEEAERCWMAYGDGYLDGVNAARGAAASARLSAQLAIAFDRGRVARMRQEAVEKRGESKSGSTGSDRKERKGGKPSRDSLKPRGIGQRLIDSCLSVGTEVELQRRTAKLSQKEALRWEFQDDKPLVVESNTGIAHLYRRKFTPGMELRASVEAKFQPDIAVRSSSMEVAAKGEATKSKRRTEINFEVTESGDYFIMVSAHRPGEEGDYTLTISEVKQGQASEARCPPLFAFAKLFDPAPWWTTSREYDDANRRELGIEERAKRAERIVNGLDDALDRLGRDRSVLVAAQAGVESGSQPNTLTNSLIGSHFRPAVRVKWRVIRRIRSATGRVTRFASGRSTQAWSDQSSRFGLVRPRPRKP
jgi:hypothetical protein